MNFTVTTKHYLVTVVTKPEVLEHLIPNIKKLDIVYFIRQEFTGGRPKDAEDKEIAKVEMLCEWGKLGSVMNYIKDYYVKGFGAVCYYIEVNVPI